MHALALAVLIYFAVSALWDLLDPNAITMKFGSTFRGLVALAAQVAVAALCFVVLGTSGGVAVALVLAFLLVAVLAAVADR